MGKKERSDPDRRYTFKLDPTPVQEAAMLQQCRMIAELWNALLQRNEDCYRRTRGQRGVLHADGKSLLTHFDMLKEITLLRRECPEWRALSSWTGNRVAFALDQAFKGFFRRMKELSDPAVYEGRAAEFRKKKGRNPTRYELAGYPQYRSTRRANWLPR